MSYQRLLLISVLIFMLALAGGVNAGDGDLGFTLDCQGFESSGGSLSLNRDNTGAQSEAFIISAIDGGGNSIFAPDYDVFFVGTTITVEPGAGDSWTRTPRYNPLVLQIVSPAGNGLDEQIISQVVGSCDGLPRFGPINVLDFFGRIALRTLTGEAYVLQPVDGETSDPLELNAIPPRPINPPGMPEMQPGYAVVNTDNLFLRSGDSPRYEVIGIVDGGTELIVLGRNDDRSWWYVQVGGMRGWSKSEFLVLRGDLTGVPEVPVLGSFTQPSMYVGYTQTQVNTLPRVGSETLCLVDGNLNYAIVGRTSNSTWYEVEVPCGADAELITGWILAERGIVRNPANLRIPVTFN